MFKYNFPSDCIVFDTETTGFDPFTGDRIVEIGAVKMENGLPTDQTYHQYINPERIVPHEAVSVHGLTTERLSNEPVFAEIATSFLHFIGDLQLIAHNAKFDAKFLNYEFSRLKLPEIPDHRFIDTIPIAKRRFPGAMVNLDSLCNKFKIPNTNRKFHGALLDANLLSLVCVELSGGRQETLFPSKNQSESTTPEKYHTSNLISIEIIPNPHELTAHNNLIKELGENSIWSQMENRHEQQ